MESSLRRYILSHSLRNYVVWIYRRDRHTIRIPISAEESVEAFQIFVEGAMEIFSRLCNAQKISKKERINSNLKLKSSHFHVTILLLIIK